VIARSGFQARATLHKMSPPEPRSAAAPADPQEAALLARLRAGDESAYETMVRTYGGRLLATAQRILGSEDDARDAVQDAFLSAFRSIGRFAGGAKLSTWLHQIVINASLMKLRTRRRHPEEPIEPLLPLFAEDGHHVVPSESWREGADIALERAETRNMVRKAIQRLPETYRTVLLLRDIEEVDTLETARLLGVTTNVVKTRLHRARQALKTLLDTQFREARA
jgi:RNA polymerase sigma-70 factor (ECF subfamily)